MPSYTFTLNVETKIAEARLRAFRATAEKELSSIQAATSNVQSGGGRGNRQVGLLNTAAQVRRDSQEAAMAAIDVIEKVKARSLPAGSIFGLDEKGLRQYGLMQARALEMNKNLDKGQVNQKKSNQWSNLDHVLKTGFLAYGTYLAASKAIAGIYDFGKVGAQQERTAQTFEQLAQRIGVSADGMRAAVQRASHGTIDEMTGMGLSAQVLAQNFAGSLDDIEGDTEILIRAARRFSQVYTDENGQNLSTQAIYARLIKFSREGNKELVDQFGLSNELIANLLNIPNIGLRGAEGAENRWKGMIMALELELKKLGEATDTPADKIEAAEARWTTAVNKIRESTIGLSTGMVETAATAMEGVAVFKGKQENRNRAEVIKREQVNSSDPVIQAHVEQLRWLKEELVRTNNFMEYNRGLVTTLAIYDQYIEQIRQAAEELKKLGEISQRVVAEDFGTGSVSPEGAAKFRFDRLSAGKIAPADMTESESKYRMAVGGAAEKMKILQAAVDAATENTDEYWAAMAALSGATLSLAGEIDGVKGRFLGLQSDIEQYQLDLRLGAAGNDAEKRAILQGLNLSDSTPEGRRNALEIQSLDRSIAQENRRLGEEAQREWKQTAKDVEQMFESAADKIMGIPGVTSLTPVTEQEMLDTRYGAYTDKADEWMRRVRDEVMDFTRDTRTDENGVTTETLRPRVTRDYSDVSREQVEKLTGMAAGTPHDVMIPRLERMWESGSLFADKNNLGLMNMDSIRASFEEMKQGTVGRQNQRQYIMEQLGVSMSDASLITGTQAPIVQMMTGGQSEEEITAQLGPVANTLRSAAMASLTSGTGFMAEISAGWKKDIDENITKLDPLGDMIGRRLRDRINTTIGGLGLIDGIVARVIAELADGGV